MSSQDLALHLVAASRNVIASDAGPSDGSIEEALASLCGRRAGALVLLSRGGGESLCIAHAGGGRYRLGVQRERRGHFENTDAGLRLDQVIEIAHSFAHGGGWWWTGFHWRPVRGSASREAEDRGLARGTVTRMRRSGGGRVRTRGRPSAARLRRLEDSPAP